MATDFPNGSATFPLFGRRRLRSTELVTNEIFVVCAQGAGKSFGFGSIRSSEILTDALNELSVH